MTTASERGWPTVYPHLRYADPETAIAWLVRVFGFREVTRASRPGHLIVSELEGPDGGTVTIASLDDEFRAYIRSRVRGAELDKIPYPWLSVPP